MTPLGLYVHIPFCVRKCAYCDFLSFPADEESRRAYTDALVREIAVWGGKLAGHCAAVGDEKPASRTVTSVFVGGGTPTCLESDCLRRIFEAVREAFPIDPGAEVTIEMNPGTDREDLDDVLTSYVNRISLGLQSLHDSELRELGRIHTAADLFATYDHLRRIGLQNINIDLMSALPHQTLAGWSETLEGVCALKPEHISAYSLIIEEGTPFSERYCQGERPLPDEETERAMDRLTREILQANGFHRYEISNYAQPGRECRHNRLYWTGGEYLGLGLGASSYLGGARFRNTAAYGSYLSMLGTPDGDELTEQESETFPWIPEKHILTENEQMEEALFLGLRLIEGISGSRFRERFGRTIESIYGPVIDKHISDGLIRRTADGIALTERGMDISNYVLSDYLLNETLT